MIRKTAISWYDVEEKKFGFTYNTKNHSSYTPYVEKDEKIVVDRDWWNSLLPKTRERIELILKENALTFVADVVVSVPHEIVTKEWTRIFYVAYLDQFDYHVWFDKKLTNGPKNVALIPLSAELRKQILENDFSALEPLFSSRAIKGPLFVRLSGTSGKNALELAPLHNFEEVQSFLTKNSAIRKELQKDKETCLVLMPWNEKLLQRYEFRLFVCKRKATAISQQDWHVLYQFDDEELDSVLEAFRKEIPFINELPYDSFVADVYVDMFEKTVCLIECNPFGAFSASGSNLFNWIDDFQQLYGLLPDFSTEFRFLSLYPDRD